MDDTTTHAPSFELPKRSKVKKSEALWLMSFCDLSLILISFFILMLSFADVNRKKAEAAAESMTVQNKEKNAVKPDSLITINKKLNEAIKKLKIDKNAEVIYDSAGLSIEFKDALLFSFGSATPNPQFRTAAKSILKLIAKTPEKFNLRFEGHTDNVPIATGKYPSNWELSSARGISLMREFEKLGVQTSRMSVLSYAHTRPKVPYDGLSESELIRARAQNRRVVIRIE